MPLGQRGRMTGGSEDRLGKGQNDSRGSRRDDRLGRIQSEWMLPEAAAASNTSLGAQPRPTPPPVIPQSNLKTAAPESFKGGGGRGGDTVSTCSLSTRFSSSTGTTNSSSSTSNATMVDTSNMVSGPPGFLSLVATETTTAGSTSKAMVDAVSKGAIGNLSVAFSSATQTSVTRASSNPSNPLGGPLPGLLYSPFSSAAASAPALQPPIHRPNPPTTELMGGVGFNNPIPSPFGGASSVLTGLTSDSSTLGFNTFMGDKSSLFPIENPFANNSYLPPAFIAPAPVTTRAAVVAAAPVADTSAERAAAERAMFKKTGVPKAALHCWYGQKPRRQIVSQENYITWHDNGPPHLMHYTSLFICPMTGEAFGSGRYGDEKHYKTDTTVSSNIVWYKRKALAEHGAAARAFDCLVFREAHAAGNTTPGSLTTAEYRIGKDEPYLAAAATTAKNISSIAAFLAVPSHVPSHLRAEVEAIIRQGQAHMAHATTTNPDKNEDHDDDDVQEAAWTKNAYEQQHDRDLQQQSSQRSEQEMLRAIFDDADEMLL
jgi:hypothetical protein